MKTTNKYPKENTSKHIELAEGNEPNEMVNEEEENNDNTTIACYEDEDSTHYSVGGDNGW